MSTEENIIEQVEQQEEETLKRLISEIVNNPEKYATESKFILTLETWSRQGPSYLDYNDYRVLEGEVREIILNEIDEGYPYRVVRKVALIPLSMPTVIMEEGYNETTEPIQSRKFIHIFTRDGWKVVHVY
jgi:hypothetical protein